MKRRALLVSASAPLVAAAVGARRGVIPPKDYIVVENETRREALIVVDVSNERGRPLTTQHFRVPAGGTKRATYRAGSMTPAVVTVKSAGGARAEVEWPGETASPLDLRVVYRGEESDPRFDVESLEEGS